MVVQAVSARLQAARSRFALTELRVSRSFVFMQTVCELKSFRRAAVEAGMSDDEIDALVEMVAANPLAGDEMQGTGGCRKLRVAGRGKGKSGGYRTITFFTGEQMPVFLITVFAKGDKANLTKSERNALAAMTATLADSYRGRITRLGVTR